MAIPRVTLTLGTESQEIDADMAVDLARVLATEYRDQVLIDEVSGSEVIRLGTVAPDGKIRWERGQAERMAGLVRAALRAKS